MSDYKKDAAQACLQFLKPGQTIGLGAGSTISHLVDMISGQPELAESLTFVSSSFKTRSYLQQQGMRIQFAAVTAQLDIYFDGCDQLDQQLNALKSGGGIHTSEKILAAMATEFILIGDESKYVAALDAVYPLVIEILPEALPAVLRRLQLDYPAAEVIVRTGKEKDGAVISDNGNFLADIRFVELPELAALNVNIKMIPGIVEHSLFYGLAVKAVLAGEKGIQIKV
jgi:ribose 5-phosphate isomerase A